MMSNYYIFILMFSTYQLPNVSTSELVINPIKTTFQSNVTITCRPGNISDVVEISRIRILRNVKARNNSLTSVAMVTISRGQNTPELRDQTIANRSNVSGTINDTDLEKSFLKIVLSRVICRDASNIVCIVDKMAANSTSYQTNQTKTFSVLNCLKNINAIISPLAEYYRPGDQFHITCSLPVLDMQENISWKWQWRVDCGWEDYPYAVRIQNHPENVETSNSSTRATTLSHLVTTKTYNIYFLCMATSTETYSREIYIKTGVSQFYKFPSNEDDKVTGMTISYGVIFVMLIISIIWWKSHKPRREPKIKMEDPELR